MIPNMPNYDKEFYVRLLMSGKIDDIKCDSLDSPFDITSEDFLEYSKKDLKSDDDHKLINSLSNTKRAIHCQVDSLLCRFGFYNKNKRKGFPEKIEIIRELGVLSPNILTRINKKRNLLEHEYVNPTIQEVEDALDIAELFIESSNKYLSYVPRCYSVCKNGDNMEISFHYGSDSLIFYKYIVNDNSEVIDSTEEIVIDYTDPDYERCMKRLIYLEFMDLYAEID